MVRNSKGITLIEVLLALAISSIILVILWNLLGQGIQFSNSVSTKNSLQQEANYILKSITRLHQTVDSDYTISFDQNPNATYIRFDGSESLTVSSPNYTYSIYTFTENDSGTLLTNNYQIDPNNKNLPIKIIIKSISSPVKTYELKTILSKIRED